MNGSGGNGKPIQWVVDRDSSSKACSGIIYDSVQELFFQLKDGNQSPGNRNCPGRKCNWRGDWGKTG